MRQSNNLSFDCSGYGDESVVEVLNAETFLELRNMIRDRRWHREICSDYDCTGICFAQSCKLLHIARTITGISAVVLTTSNFDV